MTAKTSNTRTAILASAAAVAVLLAGAADARAKTRHSVRTASVSVARPPVGVQAPTNEMAMSIGRGRMITLPAPAAFVWSSNPTVAQVVVANDPRQVQVMGVAVGEASIFAKNAAGVVLYSTNVRVGTNVNSLDRMLKLAMPDAAIETTTMNGLVLLTGTIATPEDGAEAERLVKALVGDGVEVVSRLRTATPLQVMLQVRIAEVSRSLSKEIGVNLLTRDGTSGFQFGIAQGRPGAITSRPPNPTTGDLGALNGFVSRPGATTLGAFGRLFGLDIGTALDLAETNGLVTLLAEPNLTALSGETASFLAGGEFPIPIAQGLGQVTVEYKQYGVSLAFTPTVLADGRISMRVRPEVSQLSSEGAVTLNGFTVPAITTRRTETTVELGSGQSFMIGGLLQNNNSNSIQKAPGLGDVPVLGALFRSTSYRRNQTELMIIVTPYLVKPIDANRIALPTDGLRNPTDLQNFLLGQDFSGRSGGERPKPRMAPPTTVPAMPPVNGMAPAATARPARDRKTAGSAAPGFSN